MNRWNKTITDAGLNLIANITSEKQLKITRMACASGTAAAADLKTQTELTEYVADLPIEESKQLSGNVYEVAGTLSNAGVSEDFYLRQLGLFAKLGGGDEVLFMIAQVTDGDPGDRIPAAAESEGFAQTYVMDIVFSSDETVEIIVDDGVLAKAKAYTDEKAGEVSSRLSGLEGKAEMLLSDTVNFVIPAADWELSGNGYYYQTIYPYALGLSVDVDAARGTVGVGTVTNDSDGSKIKAIAEARIHASKDGAGGIVFRAYGKRPVIDIPVALNVEYEGTEGTNALMSVFPMLADDEINELSGSLGDLTALSTDNKTSAVSAINEAFGKALTGALFAENGYAVIGGLLVQWGRVTATSSRALTTVSFPVEFGDVYNVQLTTENSEKIFTVAELSSTLLAVNTPNISGDDVNIFWFAVGKKAG